MISKDQSALETFQSDLQTFIGSNKLFVYPAWDSLPLEQVSPSLDISAQRMAALVSLIDNQPGIYLTSVQAAMQKVLPSKTISSLSVRLKKGQSVSVSEISEKIKNAGYLQTSIVEASGEYSAKGQVVDFFPADLNLPIRIEVQNSQIVRISEFDPENQRALKDREDCRIIPAREWTVKNNSRQFLQNALVKIKERGKLLETPPREIARFMSAIRSGTYIPGIELLESVCGESLSSLLSFLNQDARIIIDDQVSFEIAAESYWEKLKSAEELMREQHYLIPELQDLYISSEDLQNSAASFEVHILDHLNLDEPLDERTSKSLHIESRLNSFGSVKYNKKSAPQQAYQSVKDSINLIRKNDSDLALVVATENRANRLKQILLSVDLDAEISDLNLSEWQHCSRRYPLTICLGSLSSGFELTDLKVAFVAEQEIFGDKSQRTAKKAKTTLKKIMSSLAQLQEGDYVVHRDYGIGKYTGLKHLDVAGSEADFLQIQYADSVLYLPIHNIAKVAKFQSPEGQQPKLDKLKNSRFAERKAKVRHAVESLAGDLLRLYAARSVAKGWRFDHFGAEDERFAESFAYDETPDQLKAIEDTIKDMSMDKPMDRLICGDVGFGKTEVAIRAAFKCLQHGRQVAVLAPTTILAEQHKQSFLNRLGSEGFEVDSVSRFKSPKENKESLQKLFENKLDLIVGTHRLLSKDVQFHDLGLVIIDEEHRFGVKHKERLKEIKKQVDVLTLTATPIPRTLHMSLAGLRDISVIATAPTDRRIVRTFVVRHDENLIKDAIERELNRGGQVFYLHNRIDSIAQVTADLARLVPKARFEFGHGQMSEDQLEEIMQRFMTHETDVLVSTTIIESGIDIPNANTILIERADTFGLAQLYQLRGRVGRSKRQAFAYLMIPPQGNLGPDARARLKALQALDDLGVGFNLAVRDLEIRGAGNLLGKEQSGNVLSIGFELYTKILQEAIANLKGEEVDFRESIEPEIKIPVDAYIPEDYIPDVAERLLVYQRLSSVENDPEADQLLEELNDRYGRMPAELYNLSDLMKLRAELRKHAIIRVELKEKRILLQFHPNARIDGQKVFKLHRSEKSGVKLIAKDTLNVSFDYKDPSNIIINVRQALTDLINAIVS